MKTSGAPSHAGQAAPALPRDLPAAWERIGAHAAVMRADWLDAARSLPPAAIDLVYVDPPFNTGATRSGAAGAFLDAWPTIDAYVEWIRARIIATAPTLRPTGSVLVHVDWRTSHRVRAVLDDVLGADRFVNHLVWAYGLGGSSPRRFARKHDDILFYCIDPAKYWFRAPRVPATSNRMRGQDKKATDVLAIPSINNMSTERTGWPTQKPVALLELLIGACCPPGGVVVDPCCGSGTTLVGAARIGRAALGADVDDRALTLTRTRMASAEAQQKTPQPGG